MRAGDPGQAVAVGDGERVHAERLGLEQQLLDAAGAAQERVVGAGLQLDVADHRQSMAFGWPWPLVLGAARSGFFINT